MTTETRSARVIYAPHIGAAGAVVRVEAEPDARGDYWERDEWARDRCVGKLGLHFEWVDETPAELGEARTPEPSPSLTKREHFAALAMQGLLANSHLAKDAGRVGGNDGDYARAALFHADALLAALDAPR